MSWSLQWEGAYGGWAIVRHGSYLLWHCELPACVDDAKSSIRPRIPVILYDKNEADRIVESINQKEQP